MVQQVLSFLRNLAICFWLGELLFFASIFAPRVFKVLDRPDAANLQAAIFPAYYMAAFACSVIVIITILLQKRHLSQIQYYYGLGASILGSLISAVSLWHITPTLIGLYPQYYSETPAAEAIEQFAFLHKVSVSTNGAVMLLLILFVFIFAERRQKRTWS